MFHAVLHIYNIIAYKTPLHKGIVIWWIEKV